ncbi:MAG: hypothetical protein RPU34_07630 [Candidatus Sedimenticola sp. (ex Thyasira tokunagai)]
MPLYLPPLLDLDNKPAILAGPIVRKLTRTSVSVWIALSSATPVTLQIRATSSNQQGSGSATPIQVGDNIYLALITTDGVDGSGEFLPGEHYQYWITPEIGNWARGDAPIWSELAYGAYTTPSFIGIPDDLATLRIAHTSCRKPHGGGIDGLTQLDADIIEGERPHCLMLGGDQIYADDVAAPMMLQIQRLNRDLFHNNEDDVFAPLPLLHGRQMLNDSFGFSSVAQNHLWQFDEFMAMYLLAWSDTLWLDTIPDWAEVADENIANDSGMTEALWDEQRSAILTFHEGLPTVRKILANVPVYMMFDDHEITDDWNISHQWVKDVYHNSRPNMEARRIVCNGMLAYTLCQHWGNVPERFSLAGSAENQLLNQPLHSNRNYNDLEQKLGLPEHNINLPDANQLRTPMRPFPTGEESLTYHYQLSSADGYPLRIIAVDPRSFRGFSSNTGPAALIAPDILDIQIPAPTAQQADSPTVIIMPAPFLGVHLLEHYVQPLIALLPGGIYKLDYEGWTGDETAFEQVMARLAQFKSIAILSGDVHYGFTKSASCQKQGQPDSQMAQFTVSAAKNAEVKTIAIHLLGDLITKLGIERQRDYSGFNSLTTAEKNRFFTPPNNANLPYDDMVDVLLGRTLRRVQEQPIVISKEIAEAYNLGNPDFSYTIKPVIDESLPTTGSSTHTAISSVNNTGTWNGWDIDNSVDVVEALQACDLYRMGRAFAGLPQVAQVSFNTDSGIKAQQVLHYASSEDTGLSITTDVITEVELTDV